MDMTDLEFSQTIDLSRNIIECRDNFLSLFRHDKSGIGQLYRMGIPLKQEDAKMIFQFFYGPADTGL